MGKLVLYIANSLDGKIARSDGSFDWLPPIGENEYGYQEFYNSVGTIVMGYKTYEVCLGLGEWFYKDKISYVFSRNPRKQLIPEAHLVQEEVVAFVKKLKRESKQNIWLLGGGEIVSLLHNAGLIDEYILAYIPIILGEGIPLFPAVQQQQNLRLAKHQVWDNGVILLYLERLENTVLEK